MGRVGPKEKRQKKGPLESFQSALDTANQINKLMTPAKAETVKTKPLVGDFIMDDDEKNPFRIG